MGGFFQELAKKLAERWVALLLLPGALFVVLTFLGVRLGHAHALDWARAVAAASGLAQLNAAGQVGMIIGLVLAASGAGLAVQAMAGVTRGIWLGRWPFATRWWIARRRARWHDRLRRRRELESDHPVDSRTAAQQQEIDLAAARVTRLAMAEPGRSTWMGDRIHAVEQVALHRYGLDLTYAWPRLWLVLPDTTRAEITAAGGVFAAAVAVGSWAWPFLVLGTLWWPAGVVAITVGVTGWVRARSAITDLSSLSEAALDLHGRALAAALGIADDGATGPLTIAEGARITAVVRKGR